MLFRGKQQKPRSFAYKSRFWNPEQEEFENRINDAKERYHGTKDENFVPGQTRFDFRQSQKLPSSVKSSRFKTDNYGKINPYRLLALLGALVGLIYFVYVKG